MESLIFPLILLVILAIFAIVFFVVTKKQEKGALANANKNNNKKNTTNTKSNSDGVKKEDVFKFLEFDRILDDMIVQNNGTKFTMAIKCKGINYDLMSDVEQISVEEGFITFLNTLRYPIQLYVQAQNVDLKGAINKYKQNIGGIVSEFQRVDEEYNKIVDSFDSSEDEINKVESERNKVLNVYEYAADIINYVERLSLNKSLLQRNFYVLVSYHTSEIASMDKFNKDEIINICYNELLTRAQSIISALGACSVSGEVLDSNEVADLLYNAYNRDDKGLLSVKEALDSGFYRLYSTSKDAFDKKTEMLQEEIRNEARIKALTAMKKTIEDGTYVSPKLDELDFEEQSSKIASEMVRLEDAPREVKEAAQKVILDDFKKKKSEILNDIREEKLNILAIDVPEQKEAESTNSNNNNLKTNVENVQKEENINNTSSDDDIIR